MKTLNHLTAAALFALTVPGTVTPAVSQYYYGNDPHGIQSGFWNSYYAAQNGFNSIPDNSGTEALINEMRAQRGAPPCAFGLLDQLTLERPAC